MCGGVGFVIVTAGRLRVAQHARGHCHVGDFYLSTGRPAHRPQTGKSTAWSFPWCCRTPPESTILDQRDNASARDQLRDTDADGLPEIAHTIERFDFGHAAGVVTGFQDISDHALVTTDCRFDLR